MARLAAVFRPWQTVWKRHDRCGRDLGSTADRGDLNGAPTSARSVEPMSGKPFKVLGGDASTHGASLAPPRRSGVARPEWAQNERGRIIRPSGRRCR
jgi:hypothetical protein